MKSEEFGHAASDVILSTLKIYIEAAHLMRDLRAELQQDPMRVFPFASVSDGDLGLKTLKGWRGLLGAPGLYEPGKKGKSALKELDPEEEEGDAGKGRGRILKISPGRPVLFAKILLHDYPRKLEPCFVGGVLCGATTTGGTAASHGDLRCTSDQARKILDGLTPMTWTGDAAAISTDAKVQMEGGSAKKGKKKTPTLQFELQQQPVRKTLWELDGTETVQQLADALLQQWTAAGGK